MEPAPDSNLICLVGENGTGKSNILELLSASAHRLGISAGVEIPRGDPFQENHDFTVVLKLSDDPLALIGEEAWEAHFGSLGVEWDGTLVLDSRVKDSDRVEVISAGGISDPPVAQGFASHVVNHLRARQEIQHLHLDADRSYPPFHLQPHEFAAALASDWESAESKKQWAYRPSRTLYEEWNKFFLAHESQVATDFVGRIRQAREANGPAPEFEDPFVSFKDSVRKVLPHLVFVRADTKQRSLIFDTADLELPFFKLSGGEREIAFLIGQVERFQLRQGLLLIDEPELHLNPDLLRTWLAFLRDTVEEGQVWIATHAPEAVEVAGRESSFFLERGKETRTVRQASPLGERPVVSVLASSVGAPAFNLWGRRFIYIEGDRQTGERERFFRICGEPTVNRFIEGGGCGEVVRRLRDVLDLASETDEQLHVGGVIDRDFRPETELDKLREVTPVYVLECHEVENLFLHPDALKFLLGRSGTEANEAGDKLRRASDGFAGRWILQRALALQPTLAEQASGLRRVAGGITWNQFEAGPDIALRTIADAAVELVADEAERLIVALKSSLDTYSVVRLSGDLWKECLGKEVLGAIPSSFDITNAAAFEKQVVHLWDRGEVSLPEEVKHLREYVSSLGPDE